MSEDKDCESTAGPSGVNYPGQVDELSLSRENNQSRGLVENRTDANRQQSWTNAAVEHPITYVVAGNRKAANNPKCLTRNHHLKTEDYPVDIEKEWENLQVAEANILDVKHNPETSDERTQVLELYLQRIKYHLQYLARCTVIRQKEKFTFPAPVATELSPNYYQSNWYKFARSP